MYILRISDYTKYPAARYKHLGKYSGEWFRDDVLIPILTKYGKITFDFTIDEIAGCPPGWIEEVFGGLVRKGFDDERIKFIGDNEYVRRAKKFMKNAIDNKNKM